MNKMELVSTLNGMILFLYIHAYIHTYIHTVVCIYVYNIAGLKARFVDAFVKECDCCFTSYADC